MSVLEDQEDALIVVEPTVETKNVGVSETGLNLHLSPQLVVNVVLLYLLLEQHLQRHNVFALQQKQINQSIEKLTVKVFNLKTKKSQIEIGYLDFAGHIDPSEFAFAQRLSDLEVLQGPVSSLSGFGFRPRLRHFQAMCFWVFEFC